MAPRIRTPEYGLLTFVRDTVDVKPMLLNRTTLHKALEDGYVKYDMPYVVLTDKGVDRIDQLEDM